MPSLPRLVLIADGFTGPRVREACLEAVAAGVRWVLLRDHAAEPATRRAAAEAFRAALGGAGGLLVSVSGDLALAARLGIGVHAGVRGPAVGEARTRLGGGALVGFSAHDAAEAAQAVEEGADYLFFSPVYRTGSKPGHPGAGLAALEAACAAASAPVFALGGIAPERVGPCRAAGAYGVAVRSGIIGAADPAEAARAYLAALAAFSQTTAP